MVHIGPKRGPRNVGRPADGIVSPAEADARTHSMARRALLSRGGIVAAGVAGAGVVAAAAASPASAASGDPILQDTVNSAGASPTPTELDAANDTAPAFILTNTGVDTANNGAGPALRLTPSTASGAVPTASTVGGDLTTTSDGSLWFTHAFPGESPIPAPVHTDETSNVYVPLPAPERVLDTRHASLRTNIVNPTGNLDGTGRLLAGKTIFIDLDGLTLFAEALFANLTVTGSTKGGFVTVWSGASAVPNASSINFAANATLSNFVSCGIAGYSTTILNVIAIHAAVTTHVILDVAALSMPGFEYALFSPGASSASRASRLRRAQQAMRADGLRR
jgi:hypothetical protein